MKTPKDKAKDLVEKYENSKIIEYEEYGRENTFELGTMARISAVECAKIAVDEIIDSNPYYFYPGRKVSRISDHSTKEYWQEVKNELNKM